MLSLLSDLYVINLLQKNVSTQFLDQNRTFCVNLHIRPTLLFIGQLFFEQGPVPARSHYILAVTGGVALI